MPSAHRNVVILGGSIAGIAAAQRLRRSGWRARVLERAERPPGAGYGFVVPQSAVLALEELAPGLIQRIGAQAIEMFELYGPADALRVRQPLPGAIGVPRRALVEALTDGLPDGTLQAGAAVEGLERREDGLVTAVRLRDGTCCPADLVLVAEGLHSTTRAALFPDARLTASRVTELVFRVRDADLARALGTTFRKFQPDEGGRALGIVACGGDAIVWYVQLDATRHAVEVADAPAREAFVRATFADAGAMAHALFDRTDFADAHLWRTTDMDALPALHVGNVALIGDAAHPVLPFTSQGVGAAANDVLTLAACLDAHPHDLATALGAYSAARTPVIAATVAGGRALRERFLHPERFEDGPTIPIVK